MKSKEEIIKIEENAKISEDKLKDEHEGKLAELDKQHKKDLEKKEEQIAQQREEIEGLLTYKIKF